MQDPASPQKVLRDRGTNLKVAEFTTFPVSVFSCEVIAGGVEAVGSAAKAGTEMATAIIFLRDIFSPRESPLFRPSKQKKS